MNLALDIIETSSLVTCVHALMKPIFSSVSYNCTYKKSSLAFCKEPIAVWIGNFKQWYSVKYGGDEILQLIRLSMPIQWDS